MPDFAHVAAAAVGAILLSIAAPALAFHELHYARAWCAAHGGQSEVVLDGGTRADCITDHYAVEVDWGHKWYEAVGQSLWYADKTDKQPGVMLILKPGDDRYLRRLRSTIGYFKLPIRVWTVDAK